MFDVPRVCSLPSHAQEGPGATRSSLALHGQAPLIEALGTLGQPSKQTPPPTPSPTLSLLGTGPPGGRENQSLLGSVLPCSAQKGFCFLLTSRDQGADWGAAPELSVFQQEAEGGLEPRCVHTVAAKGEGVRAWLSTCASGRRGAGG